MTIPTVSSPSCSFSFWERAPVLAVAFSPLPGICNQNRIPLNFAIHCPPSQPHLWEEALETHLGSLYLRPKLQTTGKKKFLKRSILLRLAPARKSSVAPHSYEQMSNFQSGLLETETTGVAAPSLPVLPKDNPVLPRMKGQKPPK